jgi:phytoene synthase
VGGRASADPATTGPRVTARSGPAALARPVVSSHGRDPEVAALLPTARTTIERAARTFAVAARLLPRAQREDVELLYLVLRTLDDLVDLEAAGPEDPSAVGRLEAVEAWARDPATAPAADLTPWPASPGVELTPGVRVTPEVRILADLARRHPSLPRDAIADFTDGMRQDLRGPTFETEAELDEYCYRVAGTVGRLMAAILGADGPDTDAAARSLGIAMQRTNVLRDIDEDLAHGRCYLPARSLERHGIPDAGALVHADRRALLREEIALADAAYDRGMAGIGQLRHGRRSVRVAAHLYREILRQIERDGMGRRRPHRAVVPRSRKLVVIGRVLLFSRR